MSGKVVSVPARRNVCLIDAVAGDGPERLPRDADGRPTGTSITSTALSARRSIAISALALADQSHDSVLELLRAH